MDILTGPVEADKPEPLAGDNAELIQPRANRAPQVPEGVAVGVGVHRRGERSRVVLLRLGYRLIVDVVVDSHVGPYIGPSPKAVEEKSLICGYSSSMTARSSGVPL